MGDKKSHEGQSERKASIAGRRMSLGGPHRQSMGAPSFMGLMAQRRFASKLADKKRRSSSIAASNVHVEKEPTYRMAPTKKFSASHVNDVLKEFVNDRLQGYRYHGKFAKNLARVLGDEVKDKIKSLHYDRYKIVCTVILGELKDQDMVISSRCAWDVKTDNSVSYTHKTRQYFCNINVFGVYRE